MKSRQRASAKPYRIVFGKAQAGVFALALLALLAVSFNLGYFRGVRGASKEVVVAAVKTEPEAIKKGTVKKAEREAVAAQKKMPEREAQTEMAKKPADVIQPKFYQDLLKENHENEQPIEPIKLPEVKKEMPSKPTPPLAASVEKLPGQEKLLEKKTEEKRVSGKKENTNGNNEEALKQVETKPRDSKPWAKAGGYTIQVVSVKKFDEALRVVQKLRDAGFQPFIKNVDLGARGKWYRVRVGHYRDKAEAQKTLSEMRVRIKLQRAKIMAM